MLTNKQKKLLVPIGIGVAAYIGYKLVCNAKSIKKAKPIKDFEIDKYAGKWYEIARMNNRNDRNLTNVTATYIPDEDGSVIIHNHGYDAAKSKWRNNEGVAIPSGAADIAQFNISYFGPVNWTYTIIALDEAYQYALVAGKNLDYLWILSREKTIPASIERIFLEKAALLGYKTRKLIWTEHD